VTGAADCGDAGLGDAGLRWRIDGEGVVVEVTRASMRLRRELGPVAWSLLETFVLAAQPGSDGQLVARGNARDVAAAVGVGRDSATKALVVLRDRQLIALEQPRHHGGRFGTTRYVIRVGRRRDVPGEEPRARRRGGGRQSRVATPTLFDSATTDTDATEDDHPTGQHADAERDPDSASTPDESTTRRLPKKPHTLALEMRGHSDDARCGSC
jgi:hypothetical protein